jgi:peptidoglycan/xylan/chitin deacetylase (PgdA/CDA1 family)
MYYPVRIPKLLQMLRPQYCWQVSEGICLTFDDGPNPETTPIILEILKKHRAKAVFFLSGIQAEKFPEWVNAIVAEGHQIGNHGYAHINGWKTAMETYKLDFLMGHKITHSLLFRPAYGKIKTSQYQSICKEMPDTKVILFNLMPGDFDPNVSAEQLLKRLNTARSGDIIVLHDQEKSIKKLQYALPLWLEHLKIPLQLL